MASLDFNRMRMGNLMPRQTGTGYRLYDTFMSSVLPHIKSARNRNRAYDRGLVEDERAFRTGEREDEQAHQIYRDNLGQVARMQMESPENKPTNVVIDRFNELSAREKADIGLRERELARRSEWDEVKESLEGGKLEEMIRKNQATEAIKRDSVEIAKFKAEYPNARQIDLADGDTIFVDPRNGREIKRFGPSGKMSKGTEIEAQSAARIKEEEAKQTGRETLTADKAWKEMIVTDPETGNLIPTRYNTVTNQMERIPVPKDLATQKPQEGPIFKPGTLPGDVAKKLVQPQPESLAAIRAQAQEALNAIKTLMPERGKLSPAMETNVGWSHYPSRLWNLFPTDSREAQGTATRLKKDTVLALIGEMKSQSRTGATGFGALNLKELDVLEKAANQLDEAGSSEAYVRELTRIQERLEDIMRDEPTKDETKTETPKTETPAERLDRVRRSLRNRP